MSDKRLGSAVLDLALYSIPVLLVRVTNFLSGYDTDNKMFSATAYTSKQR